MEDDKNSSKVMPVHLYSSCDPVLICPWKSPVIKPGFRQPSNRNKNYGRQKHKK